jgi:hypothetical protein
VIPWSWSWWPPLPPMPPTETKPASPGPEAEHTLVRADEQAEFEVLAASVWRGGVGGAGRHIVVLRCWLRAHADAIAAASLGASTTAVTVVDPPWSLPGVALSTAWLCVALCRRRS